MVAIVLPLLVAVIGVLTYALADNPKVAEMGRIAFFCGLFVLVMAGGQQVVTLLNG